MMRWFWPSCSFDVTVIWTDADSCGPWEAAISVEASNAVADASMLKDRILISFYSFFSLHVILYKSPRR